MRVLVVTQLWPNAKEPGRAPFNRQQFVELSKLAHVEVIAAIPWFPGARLLGRPKRTAMLAGLSHEDTIDGISTHVMRQMYLPKYGVPIAVPLYLASLARFAQIASSFDVILGTWAYPDGCAAIVFARTLGLPCVVKVHGTDINIVAKLSGARSIATRLLPRADAIVAVSRALGTELQALGVSPKLISFVPNGVEHALFSPRDRAVARAQLRIAPTVPLLLFVGRLEVAKGVRELFDAFAILRGRMPDVMLALVGALGHELRRDVDARASAWRHAIVVAGAQPLGTVAMWMTACDVVALPSHREGTPNVVLEALASGRPVVASTVGGIADVLPVPRCGRLVPPRNAKALAVALEQCLARAWDPNDIAACGPISWRESSAQLHAVLSRTCRGVTDAREGLR
jgi:teichuronic acid biosynthesis glycosyltransferase TuaC